MVFTGCAIGDDVRAELRAQLTRATIFNRLARKADAAGQAAPALRRAEQLGVADLARALRVELARAALDAGPPMLALALLDPVLASPGPPLARAVTLVVAAEALAACGRADAAADALGIADHLCDGDGIDVDDGLLLRSAAYGVRARQHRRDGAGAVAAATARAGLGMLESLTDSDRESSEVRGELVLELVLALLDDGAIEDATRTAAPLLNQPPRAASASPAAWAALAVATRVHGPRGDHERALGLLTDAVRVAERHRLEPVLVACRDALVLIHEERGELTEALEHLRAARAAEHRRRQAVDAVRAGAGGFAPPVAERSLVSDRVAALLHREATEAVRPSVPAPGPEPVPEPVPPKSAPPKSAPPKSVPAEPALPPAEDAGSRHHPDAAGQVPVSALLPPGPAMGRCGHRRPDEAAPEPGHAAPESQPTAPELAAPDPQLAEPLLDQPLLDREPPLASERRLAGHAVADRPPPAPEIRRLEGADVSTVGLGDLLAEALAAFQEGRRHPRCEHDAGPPTIPGVVMPDLTSDDPRPASSVAEPLWQPPPRTRRHAVGE